MTEETNWSAIVMAAGRGTRLGGRKAKAFMEIASYPMITHVLNALAHMAEPPRQIVIVTHAADKKEMALLAPHAILAEQKELRGTQDAVRQAFDKIPPHKNERWLIMPVDMPLITSEHLTALMQKKGNVLAVMTPQDNFGYGRVITKNDKASRIIEEKDASPSEKKTPLVYGGIMLADGHKLHAVLDRVQKSEVTGEYYLTQCVELMSPFSWCELSEDILLGVNTPLQLAAAEEVMQKRLRHQALMQGVIMSHPAQVVFASDTHIASGAIIHPFVFFGKHVVVEKNVEVRSFSHLEEVHLEEGSKVGPFVRLRGETHVGKKSQLGNFVETKKAKIAENVKASHLSYLGDCTIGRNSNIGAGVITCNFDGARKHPTIVGEDVFIGSNASLVAPVSIGKGAAVGAGSVITRDIDENISAVRRPSLSERKKTT